MQLKILSWNIWYDCFFDEVSKFLTDFGADIICLQEVVPDDPSRDTIGYITKLGYKHVFVPVKKIEKDGRTMGNAIFSKYEITNSQTYNLSEVDSRKALRADINLREAKLSVFTTHLPHTHQQVSETQKLQAGNLVKVIPPARAVLMGDFNATPDSDVVREMRKVMVDTDPKSTPTWSVYPEGCSICKPQAVDIKLDYIFTTKDVKSSFFEVHQSKGSDHLPISAIIELL